MKSWNLLSTGQIARLLHTCPRTVSKWVDSGRLPGYRLPLSTDRRVTREALLEFLRRYNIPIPQELGLPLLLVAGDSTMAEQLRPRLVGWEIEAAGSVWAAAASATKVGGRLRVAVVSSQMGRAEARAIARALAGQVRLRVVLCAEDDDGSNWADDPTLVRMQYPVGPDALARVIRLGMMDMEEPK